MRIALDAMGGDHAPGPVVAGALQAAADDADLRVFLVGDRDRILACLDGNTPKDCVEVIHAAECVEMSESPVEALRKKPDNSIARCWQLLAEGKADAVVSAGNTGAVVVAANMILRRLLPGVKRPGIATLMPTAKGPCVLLDVGANVTPRPLHLLQYATVGRIFAKHILNRESPRVGLLNVGEEAGKGHEVAKTAHDLIAASPLRDSFLGNVEGRDIHAGKCDVVVTDGFVGNIVLKACEGLYSFLMREAGNEIKAALGDAAPRAGAALMSLAERYDYSTFGGAPLLGIDGIGIICHGSSGDRAIRNALKLAANYARQELNRRFVEELAALPSEEEK